MLARLEYQSKYSRASGYFMTLMADFQQCMGCPESGGTHIQITNTLRRDAVFQLQASDYIKYDGLISAACRECFCPGKILTRPTSVEDGCWRRRETMIFCTGARKEIRNIVVSLPVILAIEIGDECIGQEDQQCWDFPPTISPDSGGAGSDKESVIIYDLVGYVLINYEHSHFAVRYICSNDSATIYTYDSMRHKGYPIIEKKATFNTHMVGRDIILPDGFTIWEAFYHLRGGLAAQDKFYKTRIEEYQDCFSLSFSEPNLDKLPHALLQHASYKEMQKNDRNWMANPAQSETAEYVSIEPPPRPAASTPVEGPESEEETSPPLVNTRNLTITIPALPLSQYSPHSDFDVNCCCGATGNGNVVYYQEDGEVVQCDECKDWSHITCQRDGRASNLPKNKPFLCDSCDPEIIKAAFHGRLKKR